MAHLVHVNCWQCNRRLTSQSGDRYVSLRVDPKTLDEILVCSEACAERARRDRRWDPPDWALRGWRVSSTGRAHWFGRGEVTGTTSSVCLLGTSEGLRPTDRPQDHRPCLPCINHILERLKACQTQSA